MKFAIALIAGVAILASVHAAPAAKNNVYISESLKEIIAAVRGRVQDRIDELQKSREQLRELIESATGEAKERLRESLDAITGEVEEQIKLLLEVINRAVRKNDQNYFKDGMIRRIGEYRKKAKEILQRVTEILKREATIIGEDARARMEEQRQRLIDQVQRVNEQIKQVVNEVLNGKEEESHGLVAEAYIINAGSIRAKIAELGGQLRDLTAQARAAAGVKRQEIMEQLNVVRGELVEAAKDIRYAFRGILGKEPVAYSLAANREDSYFVQTVRDLRKKLNEKLQQVKSYVEMIKGAHGLLKDQLKAGLETAKGELRTLKEEILEKVYEEVNKPIAEDSNDA